MKKEFLKLIVFLLKTAFFFLFYFFLLYSFAFDYKLKALDEKIPGLMIFAGILTMKSVKLK